MNNLDKQYTDLLQDILDNGVTKSDRTGTGTISVFGRQIRHKMSDGFPLLTTKKMAWKQIVTELLWFLRGDTNIKFLVDNDCHIWDGDAYKNYLKNFVPPVCPPNLDVQPSFYEPMSKEMFIKSIQEKNSRGDEFANKWGELGPIYGRMWRAFDEDASGGIDQIANLINDLKTNPDSRRLLVTAWHPGYNQWSVLPPCHYGFQVYTRELSFEERYVMYIERLDSTMVPLDIKVPNIHQYFTELNIPTRAISLSWNQRSVDTALGWPFNVASYGLLLELLGKIVNMIPDELICNLGDVHIYNNHIDGVKEQISREPYILPKLNINTEWWPTESGECGVGPIDAQAVLRSFSDDNFCKCLMEEDIQLYDYQSHPKIYFPLSN